MGNSNLESIPAPFEGHRYNSLRGVFCARLMLLVLKKVPYYVKFTLLIFTNNNVSQHPQPGVVSVL